jgi:iron complex outermembrane receptor protein
VELDLWLRYVSSLSFQDASGAAPVRIDDYLTLDCRLAWRPWRGVELALVGQNLLQDEHREFLPQQILTQPTQVGRSFYGKATWQF